MGKTALILGEKCPDCGHYGLDFSFKMQFLEVPGEKKRSFFPAGPFFFMLEMIVYRSALIPKKHPFPKKFPVRCLLLENKFQSKRKTNT